MPRLKWYLAGLPLAARLLLECLHPDPGKPLPSAGLRGDIDAFRARRPT